MITLTLSSVCLTLFPIKSRSRHHVSKQNKRVVADRWCFRPARPYKRGDWQDALSRIRDDAREDWSESSAALAENPNDEFTAIGEWSLFLTRRMHNRGVPIGAGTDTPLFISVPGYSLHSDLEMLVRAGLSPLEAIRSATIRPAEFFSLADEMGTIEEGKKADLVLLNANAVHGDGGCLFLA